MKRRENLDGTFLAIVLFFFFFAGTPHLQRKGGGKAHERSIIGEFERFFMTRTIKWIMA